jgi:tetratricopeptide (TPR) repeat protein
MKSGSGKLILVVLAIGLVVLFMVLPRVPKGKLEEAVAPVSDIEMEVAAAVQLVQNSASSAEAMQGIMKLREIVERDSTIETAQLWLGYFSLESGQRDKARGRFETVRRLNPNNPEPYWQMGIMAVEDSSYAEAVEMLTTCVGLDSSYVNGLFFVARSYEEMGDTQNALSYYKEYLPYAPDTTVSMKVEEFISVIESNNK